MATKTFRPDRHSVQIVRAAHQVGNGGAANVVPCVKDRAAGELTPSFSFDALISGAAITAVCSEAINGLILTRVGGLIVYVVGTGQSVRAGLG